METSRLELRRQRPREECEPGLRRQSKILPEPKAELVR